MARCCDGWRPRAGTASRARHSGTISSAASEASTTKIARHENSSVRIPPSAAPASSPQAEAATRFAIASCRRSYGTSSPTATSASGKNAAAMPPVTSRIAASTGRLPASVEAATMQVKPTIATEITRIGPTRSASGPHASWKNPYGIRYAVIAMPAAGTDTPRSAAMSGSTVTIVRPSSMTTNDSSQSSRVQGH